MRIDAPSYWNTLNFQQLCRRHSVTLNTYKNIHTIIITLTNSLFFPVPGYLLPFRKPKRVRTAFSPTQLLKLEHAFENNHYVVGSERKSLAQALGLTETQVRRRVLVNRSSSKNQHLNSEIPIKSNLSFFNFTFETSAR